MKRAYCKPEINVVQVEEECIICTSYGSVSVGGRTGSFDDATNGSFSAGGSTNEFDAAAYRRGVDWEEYERY
ncbi:MAG: hypothetical protein K6E73_08135 [Bacteroidales bacterium]|nr:hypothetical protein [Bacteroidales bacterium]